MHNIELLQYSQPENKEEQETQELFYAIDVFTGQDETQLV